MNRIGFAVVVLSLGVFAGAAQAQQPEEREGEEQEAEGAVELDRVQVIGRAQRLYQVEESGIGTRTSTPLAFVPQSVQVIPQELIEDQAARQITDLYRSISGVSFFSYAGVTFRGFRQEGALYDGLRGDPYAGFAVPQLFNVERVEVLKGPAGALYGSGDPGGTINYVSKRPERAPLRRIELQAGNYDYAAGSFEATGPIDTNERAHYRAGIYRDQENPFRFHTGSENRLADAGLAFDVGQSGELLLQLTDVAVDLDANRLRGVSVDDTGRFLTDIRWNHNEPTDFLTMDARIALARLGLAPADAVDLDVALRWFENEERQNYHEPLGLIDRDADGTAEWMVREFRDQIRRNEGLTANANLVWRFATGGIGHTLLAGAEWFRQDSDFGGRFGDPVEDGGLVPGIDVFAPIYGQTSGAAYGLAGMPYDFTYLRSTRHGAYLQDQLALGERWQVLAGLRWDGFEDEDRQAGSGIDGHDLSWRLGATVTLREGVNAYAVAASGFLPQNAGNQLAVLGGPFGPERSRLWELGMKTVLGNGRFSLNGALYRIERRNILQSTGEDAGGDGVDDLAPLGLVRSDGFELDLLADLTERWVLNLVYSYNDARVLDAGLNGVTNAVSGRFVNAPRHTLGLWTRYDLPALRSAIAFGADHVGERISFDAQAVKAYTVFDASWQTRWNDWKFQLNVKNLFDKIYAASGFNRRGGHFPGEPRRVYVQATYEF